jgi:Fe-S oxidoreductase
LGSPPRGQTPHNRKEHLPCASGLALTAIADPAAVTSRRDSRQNGIFDPARRIIDSIPGAKRVEMKRSGQWSFCCGAGGGRMFMEETRGSRINENRTKEAVETGAKTIGVSCPFCMTMISDGLKALGKDETHSVKELTELLAEKAG